MTDNIDELLEEFENTQDPKEHKSNPIRLDTEKRGDQVAPEDDITSILDDPDVELRSWASSHGRGKEAGGVLTKCAMPMLSGARKAKTTGTCENLLCSSCDSPIIRLEGFRWRDKTDYLFLRTNYPDRDKLKAFLEPSRPHCAYACQCSHLSVTGDSPVNQLKWMCRGHYR